MSEVFFYFFSVLSIVFAAVAVTSQNIIRGGVALLGCFVSLGAVYFTVGAEFLGIVQVIVYGGAIIVLYLFALMTMDLASLKSEPFKAFLVAAGGLLSVVTAFLLLTGGMVLTKDFKPSISGAEDLALPMFFKFLLPFEVVSVLLLIATVGAVAIGRRES
ncbi:NADH-quinone oxidoreductase subunit J family protein [Phorcysia thermohydrogeniphila]|uniref:NADH-quinone oxidoreductase subunit J n=1 Tax=Phorcysia thermohydrogeniphila TaxID=936138 RepID=A0A4R1GLW2_9BACT|nr:NADH-quinone oxidoreductase subunit J [Phorcysia thermohydrogeniphila]TCK05412.1 NADH-quinone oxidoreductase subunit J [Phorcysia thermohydrogeniphila]